MPKDSIDYTGIFCNPPTPDHRFVLKKNGKNPLFVIGLNPSLASEYGPDQTVREAMKIKLSKKWEGNDFGGFVMFNLYPLRTPDPKKLPEIQDKTLMTDNVKAIEDEVNQVSYPVILAAWGDNIEIHDYLSESLQLIVQSLSEQTVTWLHFGEWTQKGHPRHLLHNARNNPNAELTTFDIDEYLKKLK